MVHERASSSAGPSQPSASSRIAGPVRMCLGCRERAAKSELLRLTAGTDVRGRGVVVPDPSGSVAGRGAYLHPVTTCCDLAVRRRVFARAFRVREGLAVDPVREYLAALDSTDD